MRFPGQYYDAETGLHYNWHRYYDPEIGRYLKADKLLEMIGTMQGALGDFKEKNYLIKLMSYSPYYFHLFSYAKNNPISNTDALGLFWCPEGQHLEKDFTGFLECMFFDSKALGACATCVAFAWTGVGSPLGVGMCLACLSFELHCIAENTGRWSPKFGQYVKL